MLFYHVCRSGLAIFDSLPFRSCFSFVTSFYKNEILMITRLSHYSIYVLDQDQAYDFYVNKLGFEVVTDATMDNGFRWLTVRPKDQKDTEIVLMPVKEGHMFDAHTAAQMRELIQKGKLGSGVFETNDC